MFVFSIRYHGYINRLKQSRQACWDRKYHKMESYPKVVAVNTNQNKLVTHLNVKPVGPDVIFQDGLAPP